MKGYIGTREANGTLSVAVHVDGESWPLNPRLDLANHSPDGFECGYEGSGPAQLALAILADYHDDAFALAHHQEYMRGLIAVLERGLGVKGVIFKIVPPSKQLFGAKPEKGNPSMRPEQKAAFVMAQSACAFATIARMQTVNQALRDAGEPPMYSGDDYDKVFETYLIEGQQVTKFFNEG